MRIKRHRKIRQNLSGTETAPRLCVFRSNSAIYAQIIDDTKGVTLVSSSSLELKIKNKFANIRRIIAVKGLYKNEIFEMKLSVLELWIRQKGIWKLWSRQSVSLK